MKFKELAVFIVVIADVVKGVFQLPKRNTLTDNSLVPESQLKLNSNIVKPLSRFSSNDPPDHLLNFGHFQKLEVSSSNSIMPVFNESQLSSMIQSSNGMQIRCYSEHMVIFLKRSVLRKMGVFDEAQVHFSEFDPSCSPSKKASNQSHYVLVTFYTMCNTMQNSSRDLVTYSNQVNFRLHSDVGTNLLSSDRQQTTSSSLTSSSNQGKFAATVTQEFSCTIYLNKLMSSNINNNNNNHDRLSNLRRFENVDGNSDDSIGSSWSAVTPQEIDLTSNSNFTFRLELYDNENTPWIKYPREVKEKQRIYAQITLRQTYQDDDLRALAKDCYFSKNSDASVEPRHMLLTSGCPAVNSVVLHHNRTPSNQMTRFSFLAGFYFDSSFMFFHCKVSVCSQQGGRESDRIEKCPSSTFCSEKTNRQTIFVADPIYSFVSSGPLRPIISSDNSDSSHSGNHRRQTISPSDGTFVTCPPCPAVQSWPSGESQTQQKIVITKGMDTLTVLGVAVASFIVGILLMTGLCYVHKITEPKKSPENRRKHDHDFSSLDSCSSEPTATTPMTQTTLSSKLSLPCCIDGECEIDKQIVSSTKSSNGHHQKFLQRYD